MLTITVVLTLFCIGAFIRIGAEPETDPNNNGLLSLEPGDELIAFQDFSFDAEGWSHPTTSDQIGGLGPVLGPFTSQSVSRELQVPENARSVQIIFDVNLHGDWEFEDALSVMLGEEQVLGLTIAGLSDDHVAVDLSTPVLSDIDVHVEQTRIDVRPRETAPQETEDEAILNLRVVLTAPPAADVLTLGISAQASTEAAWTLDNLAVVSRIGGDGP